MTLPTITPKNGMQITENVRLTPGTYHLPDGLIVANDNIIVEGDGVVLIGSNQQGIGLHAKHHSNITIRGLTLHTYRYGSRFDQCQNVQIENVTIRDTHEIEGIDTFLYLWQPIEDAYGGAILFNEVHSGHIINCDLQHQLNGILLYHSEGINIQGNNASFNSGWGVYLSNSSKNIIQDNQLDFCNRVYRRPEDRSVRVEADAAGIVLVNGSSDNQLLRNSCLCGGDGIFIAGYRHPGDIQPCNDNLIEENDCRLSPNNAIESTFSRGNIFRRNDCSRSNYGFWMGYSWDNILEDNIIEYSRFVGIAAEHAHNILIQNNTLRMNTEGIRLWTRGGAVVQYWQEHKVTHTITVKNNLFESNQTGVSAYSSDDMEENRCHHIQLDENTFQDNQVGVRFSRINNGQIKSNRFINNSKTALHLTDNNELIVGDDNHYDNNATNLLDV